MKRRLTFVATVALLASPPAFAADLDCGKPPESQIPADARLAEAITSPKLEAGSNNALRDAVRRLTSEGVSRSFIVDHAVAAYCPLVAKDGSLSLDAKREAVRRFASEVTSTVYDPGQGSDDVILSLPVEPILSEQIDIAAAKAGQTRDAWLTGAIRKALGGG